MMVVALELEQLQVAHQQRQYQRFRVPLVSLLYLAAELNLSD